MPSRIVRDGILSSPKVTKLGWAEEVFYRRLMSVVDDFGRFSADPGMLRSACYPRQLNKVSDSDIGKWLQVIADAALVRVYPASDGERYLELHKFGQQIRAKKSKCPEPLSDSEAEALQLLSTREADVHLDVAEGVAVSESGSDKRTRSLALVVPPPSRFPEFWEAWPKSPRKGGKVEAQAVWEAKSLDSDAEAILRHVRFFAGLDAWTKQKRQFVPAPVVYLRARQWDGWEPGDEQGDAGDRSWLERGL